MNDNKENINPESQEVEHHHMLNDYECGLIVGMYAVKKNAAAIARQFNFNDRNVRRVIKRFDETGSGLPRTHSGMKRKLNERDDRSLVRDAEKDPETTFEQHRANLAGAGVTATLPTVSSTFHRLGYGYYVAAKNPRLNESPMALMRNWIRKYNVVLQSQRGDVAPFKMPKKSSENYKYINQLTREVRRADGRFNAGVAEILDGDSSKAILVVTDGHDDVNDGDDNEEEDI